MSRKFYRPALLALAALLLCASGFLQGSLNRQRADPALGFTRVTPLENAPPVLAFTTVALGGFRGLIANALWIRANDLQQDEKYFEMVQLADWITKLEPHFVQVWTVQAWNMAFNISVKFSDPADRWRWVRSGIELLRDDGIRFNPKEALIYRELGWFFQFKMGANMDDAHNFYKYSWAHEMTAVLGSGRPNFDELLNPQTAEASNRVAILRDKYKMDPARMKKVDDTYGPLEWRLPEAHAIYWAVLGLELSNPKELIALRRVIYQSMSQTVLRGRILLERSDGSYMFGPDLSKIEQASEGYERMIAAETEKPDPIRGAHKNFLKEAIYQLYVHNQISTASRWMQTCREKYPGAFPPDQRTVEDFALQRLAGNLPSLDLNRTTSLIGGQILQCFFFLAIDEDDRAAGLKHMARTIWNFYMSRIGGQDARIGLPPFSEMEQTVLRQLLDPQGSWPPDLRARLRAKLGLPAETAPAAAKPEIEKKP